MRRGRRFGRTDNQSRLELCARHKDRRGSAVYFEAVVVPGAEMEQTRVLGEIVRNRERVAGEMVSVIVAAIPDYGSHPDPALLEDLTEHVTQNIDAFLRIASEHRPPRPEDLAFVRAAVERRIAQGVPMDTVLHAFRVGQQFLWETIVAETERIGVGTEAAISLALPAMQYTDAASSEFTECYVRIEQQMQASTDRASAQIVEALIDGRRPADRSIAALRTPFAIDADAAHTVAVLAGVPDARIDDVRRGIDRMSHEHPLRGAVSHTVGGELIVVIAIEPSLQEVPERVADSLRSAAVRGGPAIRIGISALCRGVPEIAAGHVEAAAVARTAGAGTTVSLGNLGVIERVALVGATGPSPTRLIPHRIREFIVDDLGRDGALVSTALAYVDADMNARKAAERLFLHPNTVLYRLRRIGERTGIDVRSATELLDLVTSIRILQLSARDADV
jgi:hypothetical protein